MNFSCPHCSKNIDLVASKKRDMELPLHDSSRNVNQRRTSAGARVASSSSRATAVSSASQQFNRSSPAQTSQRGNVSGTLVFNRNVPQHNSKAASRITSVSSVPAVEADRSGNASTLSDLVNIGGSTSDLDLIRGLAAQEPLLVRGLDVDHAHQLGFDDDRSDVFSLEADAPLAFDYRNLSIPLCKTPAGFYVPVSWPCFGDESSIMNVPRDDKPAAQSLESSLYMDQKHDQESKYLIFLRCLFHIYIQFLNYISYFRLYLLVT